MSEERLSEESRSQPYVISSKLICSHSLYLFLQDYHYTVDAFFYFIYLAGYADSTSLTAAEALSIGDKSGKYTALLGAMKKNPTPHFEKLKGYYWYSSRNLTNAVVDAYLCFLSSTIKAALKKRPDAVKSREQVRIDELLDHRSRREMVDYLIDRKVNSLAYSGIRGVEEYISSTLGVDMLPTSECRDEVLLFNEIRNISVHNRGYVNHIFMGRIPCRWSGEFEVGRRFHANFDRFCALSRATIDSALFLDLQISKKFGIRRKQYGTWLAQ